MLSLVKPWLPSEDAVQRRVDLVRASHVELLARRIRDVLRAHADVILSASALDVDNPLNRVTPGTLDMVSELAEGVHRSAQLQMRLTRLEDSVAHCYNVLLLTVAGGVAGVIVVALKVDSLRPLVTAAAVLLTLTQLWQAVRIRGCAKELRQYEHGF